MKVNYKLSEFFQDHGNYKVMYIIMISQTNSNGLSVCFQTWAKRGRGDYYTKHNFSLFCSPFWPNNLSGFSGNIDLITSISHVRFTGRVLAIFDRVRGLHRDTTFSSKGLHQITLHLDVPVLTPTTSP